MSSSWGNTINLLDEANDMYGKVMSLKDEFIIKYFTLTTRISLAEVEKYAKELASGKNPRDYKMKLAYEIVKFYHSEKDAETAQEYFVKTFTKKETPDSMPEIKPSKYDILTVMIESGLTGSKSDARRVVEQKGVKVNENVVEDEKLVVKSGDIIQKGKRFFVKVVK